MNSLLNFFYPRKIFRVFLWTLALAFSATPGYTQTPPPVIAAASSLRFVLPDIAAAFTRETGLPVRLSFGSSGNIARQIAQGAPYQMFLSADEKYVLDLAAAGRTVGRGAVYAYGRIVLFIPNGSPLTGVAFPDGYGKAFADGMADRFAIANPKFAPYGRAARQALIHAGLWKVMKPHLLFGENVAQTAQFAASGSAEGGIFAYSLALSPKVSSHGSYRLIAADWHAPLGQRMALIKGAAATAVKFYAFMSGKKARQLLMKNGFTGKRP